MEEYKTIGRRSLIALGVESAVGVGLVIAPGWANGWLGGRLSIFEVFSAGMTAVLFAIAVTGTTGLGAVLALLAGRFGPSRRHAGTIFGLGLAVGAISGLVACPSAYRWIYALTLEMWPDGYEPR